MTWLAFNVEYVFQVVLHYGFFRDKTRQFCSFAKMFSSFTKSAKWKGTNYIWTMQNLCNIYCCERLTILHSFCTEVGIVNAKKYVMPKFWQRSDLLSLNFFSFRLWSTTHFQIREMRNLSKQFWKFRESRNLFRFQVRDIFLIPKQSAQKNT